MGQGITTGPPRPDESAVPRLSQGVWAAAASSDGLDLLPHLLQSLSVQLSLTDDNEAGKDQGHTQDGPFELPEQALFHHSGAAAVGGREGLSPGEATKLVPQPALALDIGGRGNQPTNLVSVMWDKQP